MATEAKQTSTAEYIIMLDQVKTKKGYTTREEDSYKVIAYVEATDSVTGKVYNESIEGRTIFVTTVIRALDQKLGRDYFKVTIVDVELFG